MGACHPGIFLPTLVGKKISGTYIPENLLRRVVSGIWIPSQKAGPGMTNYRGGFNTHNYQFNTS